MQTLSTIIVFHDDRAIADRVSHLAAEINFNIRRATSRSELEDSLRDPHVAAVVLDVDGPKSGGFELLESIERSPSSPVMIVITELDIKTIESIRRLALAKSLKVNVFKKGLEQESAIKRLLLDLARRRPRFGAQDLHDALENQLIRVHYQPKVPFDPTAPRSYGVEALCRIHHPDFGEIRPDDFISIAEKEGLIAKLTDAVVRQSFRDWHTWHDQGLSLRLAINVSPTLLNTNDWAETFLGCCSEFNMATEQLILEITESSSGATSEAAVEVLTRLRLRGITLSIDDFGTGFSSLATLYKLPFGEIKIDKSFIMALKESSEARALIETSVGMAHRLGLQVTAEGVETQAVFHELRLIGCNDAQGYFISRPLPASAVAQFFADWDSSTEHEPAHLPTHPNRLTKIALIQLMLDDILDHREIGSTENHPNDAAALELTKQLPALALEGAPIAALANCHAVGRRLEEHHERVELKAKVLQLRRLLENELICKDDIELLLSKSSLRLLPRRSALIGRSSSTKPVDIAVGCRWLSRGENNLRLFSEGALWMIEDLGSTNGTCIGDQVLTRGRPFALPFGETLIEIGKPTGTSAPVGIRVRRPAASPNAVVITLDADIAQLASVGPDDLWPCWEEELKTTWIVFQDSLTVGASKNCAIVLEETNTEVAAVICFHDGFWIKPSADSDLTIADVRFEEAVPLMLGEEILLAGANFWAAVAQARQTRPPPVELHGFVAMQAGGG